MHIAARNGLVTVTQALLEKGASVTVVDVDGYTPALACAPNAQVADCLSMIIHIMIDTVRNGRRSDSLTFPLPISEFSNHHHQRLIFICFVVYFFVNIRQQKKNWRFESRTTTRFVRRKQRGI